jgi:hypothetical protein
VTIGAAALFAAVHESAYGSTFPTDQASAMRLLFGEKRNWRGHRVSVAIDCVTSDKTAFEAKYGALQNELRFSAFRQSYASRVARAFQSRSIFLNKSKDL